MTSGKKSKSPRSGFWSRRRIVLASLAGAVALYAFLGFVVAPIVVRDQILKRVGALTERPVSVARVRVNPFARSVTVEGFLVKARDGAALVSFDRLYARLALGGLLRKEIGLAEFFLERPYFHPFLDARGKLNVSDVVARLSAGDREAAPRPAGEGMSFVIGHLRVSDAKVEFSDRSRRSPFETRIGPFTLDLRNFRTGRRDNESPYTLVGTTESGEGFSWSGNVLLDPIRSEGTFSFERLRIPKYAPYYQDATSAEVRSGTLDLRATYEIEWSANRRIVRIVDGSVGVSDLALGARGGGGEPSVELARVDVKGIQSDVLAGGAGIGLLAVEGGRIRARRASDGKVDLVALLRPPEAPAAGPAPGSPGVAEAVPPAPEERAAGPSAAAPSPRFRLDELSVKALRLDVADAVPAKPVELRVDVDALHLQGLTDDPGGTAKLDAALRVDERGTLAARGTVRPLRPAADLDLDANAVDLSPLGPYLANVIDARLDEAVLGMKGHASFDGAAATPAWAFRGDVRLDGLRMADGRKGEEFLRWKILHLDGIDAAPGRTALRAVRVLSPRLRLVIWEDKVRNLDVVMRRTPPTEGGAPAGEAPADGGASQPPAPPASAEHAAPAAPASRWSVGTLQITDGRVSFVDRSVQPVVTLDVTDVAAVVRGLSSEARSSAQVQVDARIGGAPIAVTGTLQPRFLGDATDLAVRSHAIDLTPLGPYVARFAGYDLRKGKLDLDLRYAVRARTLEADNRVRIDQFTLGEERPGPDVTSLPVKLGLAILTDRNGVIDLDVPVSGSIDDPDFSLGKTIWHAVANVFTKVVTAPFAALGNLFGGGEGQTLERVDFPAGEARIDAAAERTLSVLARALRERPGLRLEIEGSADEAADGAAIRRVRAREEVRRAKWEALRAKDKGLPLDAVHVEASEYPRWLAVAWKAIPPAPGAAGDTKAASGDAKALPSTEEMEAALAAAVVVPPEAYRELASRRAEAARERLLAGGDLDPARVFVTTGGERARREGGARAYFALR